MTPLGFCKALLRLHRYWRVDGEHAGRVIEALARAADGAGNGDAHRLAKLARLVSARYRRTNVMLFGQSGEFQGKARELWEGLRGLIMPEDAP